jgi:hypothetical protein
LITSFSLGDSDANYNALLPLTTGQIPESGELLINGLQSNSTQVNTRIKSLLKFDTNGALQNQLNHNQVVTSETITNGQTLISGANISQITVARSNFLTDSYVNLFYSFGPLNSVDDNKYTGTTYVNGGYSDTALSAVAKTKIVVSVLILHNMVRL